MALRHGCKTRNGPSSEYATWDSMKQRCLNPNAKAYKNYGARGITVCERWMSFENFLSDMGRRPSNGFDLDRINNEEGYCKENCRWIERKANIRNRRNTISICIDGVTKSATEWAELAGLERHRVALRYEAGWRGQKLLKPSQKAATIRQAGGVAGVCRSVEDAQALLEEAV